MSGYGVGGFGTGFLQGFEAMGANLAKRGVLELERLKEAREARKLEAENELSRIREERLIRESDSQSRHRDLMSNEIEAKLPYAAQDAQASVEGKKITNRQNQIENDFLPGKYKATIASSEADTALRQAQAQGQQLKNAEEQQSQAYRNDIAGAVTRVLGGDYSESDYLLARQAANLGGLENIPKHIDTIHGAALKFSEAAKRGDANADDAFNTKEVMDAINESPIKIGIDKNRGLFLDDAGSKFIADSRIVRFVRNPKDNNLGVVLSIQPAPSPDRRQELERQLKTATREQSAQIEKELNPPAYEQMLTDGRTPMDLGGKALWFTPQDVQRMFAGMQGIGTWQGENPDLAKTLQELRHKFNSGEIRADKANKELEGEIKVRQENRANRREERELKRDERTQREKSFTVARRMFEKEYSTGQLGMETLTGNAAEQANAAITELDSTLNENPSLTGAQAYGVVKRRLSKKYPETAEQGSGQGGREFSPAARRVLSRYRN